MNETKITTTDLVISSGNLNNAINGLDKYVFDHCSNGTVSIDELSGLSGLVKAIVAMSEWNYQETIEFDQN